MKIVDYIIIVAVAIGIVLAIISIIKQKKSGKGCCGDCTQCRRNCKK